MPRVRCSSATRFHRRPGRRDGAGGFVLLELVLALAILALLTAIALPHARLADGPSRLRMTGHEIAVLLRRDRDAALRGQRVVRTGIDAAHGTVRSGAENGAVPVPATVALRYAGPEAAIRFSPDGSASGGTISLAGQRASARVTIVIDGLTGAVSVGRAVDDAARP